MVDGIGVVVNVVGSAVLVSLLAAVVEGTGEVDVQVLPAVVVCAGVLLVSVLSGVGVVEDVESSGVVEDVEGSGVVDVVGSGVVEDVEGSDPAPQEVSTRSTFVVLNPCDAAHDPRSCGVGGGAGGGVRGGGGGRRQRRQQRRRRD